ncbi:MAG: hypothetical protein VB089_20830 [Anaerolineaceae bacterium]|nr:hypothetical protein [Anaerolineaceae bacterium]
MGEACIHAERGPDGGVITTLVGDWADQATLFGILDRIRDLNLALLSVTSRGPA